MKKLLLLISFVAVFTLSGFTLDNNTPHNVKSCRKVEVSWHVDCDGTTYTGSVRVCQEYALGLAMQIAAAPCP
ncbi:MAG: hypothetical protein V6Z82_02675 [Flavobacteriales bacterium]